MCSSGTCRSWDLRADGQKQALPLMNIVFGNLAGDFTKYFTPGNHVTEDQFKASINRSRFVAEIGTGGWSLGAN